MGNTFICTSFIISCAFVTSTIALSSSSPYTGVESSPSTFLDKKKEELFLRWFDDNADEVTEPKKLDVIGTIPPYVEGTLIRNGPGVFGTKERRYTHIFDGLAKLTRFEIRSGGVDGKSTVEFSSKFVASLWKKFLVDLNILVPSITIGQMEPKLNLFEKFVALVTGGLFDNVPVNIEQLPDKTFAAVSDMPTQLAFDLNSLETFGKVKYQRGIKGINGYALLSTAHGKLDNGLTYNYILEFKGFRQYTAHIVRTNEDMTRESIAQVELEEIPYIHDLSVTDNFVILCVYPMKLSFMDMISGKGFLSQLQFDAVSTTKIICFPKNEINQDPIMFETQAFFSYHHVNAFEYHDSSSVILDILAYEDGSMANSQHGFLYLKNLMSDEMRKKQIREGNVWRFHLDVSETRTRIVKPEKKVLTDSKTGMNFGFELPTVSPAYIGKEYRYCYGFNGFFMGDVEHGSFMEWSLVKQDLNSSKYQVWHEECCYPSEVVFVPNPSGQNEDDGVLLSCVYDSRRDESFILVINASTMKEIARAYTGFRISPQFHGKWFAT